MTTTDIQIEQLVSKLKGLDNPTLLQRVTDFIDGMIAAKEKADWWDELPQSAKDGYAEGMKDIEAGNLIPMEDVMQKYRSQ